MIYTDKQNINELLYRPKEVLEILDVKGLKLSQLLKMERLSR
jgi:hypothetical protein